jgi:Rrf2 family protein
MRISAKTEYACVAVFELAAQFGSDKPVRIREIATRHGIPPRFLVQILLPLKGAGLVASTRGAAGGYQLIRPPEQVSLGEVMRAIEGSASDSEPGCNASPDSPAVKVLLKAWQEMAAKRREMLQRITFAELLDRAKKEDCKMFSI